MGNQMELKLFIFINGEVKIDLGLFCFISFYYKKFMLAKFCHDFSNHQLLEA